MRLSNEDVLAGINGFLLAFPQGSIALPKVVTLCSCRPWPFKDAIAGSNRRATPLHQGALYGLHQGWGRKPRCVPVPPPRIDTYIGTTDGIDSWQDCLRLAENAAPRRTAVNAGARCPPSF